MTIEDKNNIKQLLINNLKNEKEIKKIIIFGSFLKSDQPHDIDVAIIQDSNESYLPLAMKYRKKIRPITKQLAVDIIPFKSVFESNNFFQEVQSGEVIYER